MHQRLVPSEDLGSGAPIIGEPVPVLGHQGLHPAGVEHTLKIPMGGKGRSLTAPAHAGCAWEDGRVVTPEQDH